MNRRPFLLFTLLPALLVTVACTTVNYRSPEFAVQTVDHKTVAVLPFEMVFTGKAPAHLAPHQIAHIEEMESLAFQTSLYYRLLNRSSADRQNPITIALQPVEETNRILAANRIGLRDSWYMEEEELAEILGVDAVVRTRVKKTRYMSDLASFGVDVGVHVLHDVFHEATDHEIPLPIPYGLQKTHDIWADGSLMSGEDGSLLWKVAVHRVTDWTRPANDVIEGVTKKLARKFPYRS